MADEPIPQRSFRGATSLSGNSVTAVLRLLLPRFLALLLPGLVAVMPVCAPALEPERAGQESFLSRAVFADGQLWVLTDAGELSSIADGGGTRDWEDLPEPVFDLCVQGGHPMVVTGKTDTAGDWTLRHRIKDTWFAVAAVKPEGDYPLALHCTEDSATLLTTSRLVEVKEDAQRSTKLAGSPRAALIGSIHGTSDHLFVGINNGEWGGGLLRLDRHSGTITAIEHNASGDLCGGPLNASCDPVNGIASEPWQPDCIAVAIGLVHMLAHGRIVEVCGDGVELLYDKPYEDPIWSSIGTSASFGTVAFFGLTRAGNTLWAVGIDGLYAFDQGGAVRFSPLPAFEEIGGIAVSFELPDLVLVLTDVNQRRSVSGSVPILVPR